MRSNFFTYVLVSLAMVSNLAMAGKAFALQEMKIGAPTIDFIYYLPVFAAEEGGFAKQNGVRLEWTPLRGGPTLNSAIAAGHIKIAFNMVPTILLGAQGGLQVIMVTKVTDKRDFFFWARTESRFQGVKDLKGARLGVHSLGSTSHAYGRAVVKATGLERDVRFVATGGLRELVAALLAGHIDMAAGYSYTSFAKAVVEGKVRPIVNISDYLPKDWVDNALYTHSDFVKSNPEVVTRVVKSVLQGIDFVKKNQSWAIGKIMAEHGFNETEATLAFDREVRYATDFRVSREGLENVVNFLAEYNIIERAKLPAVDDLFNNRFF